MWLGEDDPAEPLQSLPGYCSARRGYYRAAYRLDEERHKVIVVRIDHRSDVYEKR